MRTRLTGLILLLRRRVVAVPAGGGPVHEFRRVRLGRVLIGALTTLACCLALPLTNAAAASTQSISWAQQGPYAYGAAGPVLNARASSGLTVSYSIVSGNCWLFGTNLIFRAAGSCVINAAQGGNASYSPANTVQQKITATAYVPRAGSVLTTAMTATGAANEVGLASTCPVGSFVVGIEPYLMPVTSWVAGAQAICGNVAGAAPGGYVGLMGGYASSGPSTGLVCPVGELAVGVYGNTGTYTATMGPRCAVPGIAAVNGPFGGGGGGSARGPFDCPSGDALIGLKGTVATGSGSDALMSLQGICGAASQVAVATTALQGSGQADVIGAVSICPSGEFVTGLTRYALSSGWTAGVSAICNVWEGTGGNANIIGGAGAVSNDWTKCQAGSPNMVAQGISGRAGTWLDAFGFFCAAYNTSGNSLDSDGTDNLLGDSGGSPQGVFRCPANDAMIGLQGSYSTTAYSGSDVMTSLKGICEAFPGGFGSAAAKPIRYKGSDHHGAVRFRMVIRHRSVLGKAAVYQYTLYDLSFATACTRGGVKVPGQVTVTGSGRHERFSLRTKRYVLTGRISGAAERPRVTGTLKVLHGACGGEVLHFRAKLAG